MYTAAPASGEADGRRKRQLVEKPMKLMERGNERPAKKLMKRWRTRPAKKKLMKRGKDHPRRRSYPSPSLSLGCR